VWERREAAEERGGSGEAGTWKRRGVGDELRRHKAVAAGEPATSRSSLFSRGRKERFFFN
jgi:hypothetical protein